MTPEQMQKKITDLELQVKTMSDIMFGLSNDNRFIAQIRNAVIVGEHITDKPVIINSSGKKYNLETL